MSSAAPIHHLDCATMCPRGAAALGLVDRSDPRIVAHCLLIEAAGGLVLVDTGFGTGDIADPRRIGPARHSLGPQLKLEQTALHQVRALGHDPGDVRHILATHLDFDHAGGLGDFPQAKVHVHRTELAAARRRKGQTRLRYRPQQWAHDPDWTEHEADGEAWFGFERARLLEDVGVEIAMIPLHGHTSGHAGYAINAGDGWLLHAGDAYLRHDEIATPAQTSLGLRTYHRINSADERLRRANVERLAELAREHRDDVTIFCAHDAVELGRLA